MTLSLVLTKGTGQGPRKEGGQKGGKGRGQAPPLSTRDKALSWQEGGRARGGLLPEEPAEGSPPARRAWQTTSAARVPVSCRAQSPGSVRGTSGLRCKNKPGAAKAQHINDY